MGICPECSQKINYLILEERTLTVFDALLGDDNKSIAKANAAVVKEHLKYYCPLCNSRLTRSGKRAVKILKNKPE